jgi:peptide deformylase
MLLHQKCENVKLPLNNNQQALVNKMINYIDASYDGNPDKFKIRSGIALAGPQVGLMYRIIYVHGIFNEIEHKYLIANPQIISESKMNCYLSSGEGCLSVNKDIKGYVKRKNKISVSAYDLLNNEKIKINAEGYLAICLQHELDHLDGILYYDRINKSNPFYKEDD